MSASRATVEAFYAAINERRMEDAIGWLAGDVRWRRPPDVPIEFGGCQVFRFDDGLIAEVHEVRSLDQGRALLSG